MQYLQVRVAALCHNNMVDYKYVWIVCPNHTKQPIQTYILYIEKHRPKIHFKIIVWCVCLDNIFCWLKDKEYDYSFVPFN